MQNNNLSHDQDPIETQEWLEALASVVREEGRERALYLLRQVMQFAGQNGIPVAAELTTPYVNTIPASAEPLYPGDEKLEENIINLLRWNAIAAVLRAGKQIPDIGGHLATYASSAVLYEVGFNHFFHAPTAEHGGDLVYIQGHGSPGIYARAFLEGRISEEQMDHFRQEIEGKGLSSYPHPWLMPDFWQFPTVSMGLGPLQAIYQARFLKYLANRGLADTAPRKVWAFCGDGEMDEPESLGALTVAAREKLDNLIFVVNCNLQRLDGPVRGNSKIIQELESLFKGAGWNVIKVIWGGEWDALFAKDTKGLLARQMMETIDGDYQNYSVKDGAFFREHFFNKYPELGELVAHLSDDELKALRRGGHDLRKVYSAYAAAVSHTGQPTVILAKTVKGYGLGAAGEGQNITHQLKKLNFEQLQVFRDRFKLTIADDALQHIPFYQPPKNSPEIEYLLARRKALGGFLPARRTQASEKLQLPALSAFDTLLKGSDREISTTMAFVRILNILVKDKNIGKRIVPIVPDESRTFGMEGMFRQLGIYSWEGQKYTPVDADQVMPYHEDKKGQILQEGINEPGAFCSWMAAGTSYSNNNVVMIPFYIYYSMFGYQRVGDLVWAAGDMQVRGFLLGATAGRTTLSGEGLQHQDGHNHLLFSMVPNCVAYDPAFAYELAVIIQDGLRRMYEKEENIFYYITVMNENYQHPALPQGVEQGILKGMYLFQEGDKKAKLKVQLLGSGTILREVLAAKELLEKDFAVSADVWSVTSFSELRREALAVERSNYLHPEKKPALSYVGQCLQERKGPVIAATDYVRLQADQIRAFVPQKNYMVLGTDGYGRSGSREQLRWFFEVDRYYVAVAALKALADDGEIPMSKVTEAMKKYKIDPKKPNPVYV